MTTNATTLRRAFTTLLASAALLTPSFAFAGVDYEDVDAIPDILSIFGGGSDAKSDAAQKDDDSRDDASEERAESTKKASSEEDASR